MDEYMGKRGSERMMDYNWIKDNLGEVKVRKGKMYIELTEDVYRVLRSATEGEVKR